MCTIPPGELLRAVVERGFEKVTRTFSMLPTISVGACATLWERHKFAAHAERSSTHLGHARRELLEVGVLVILLQGVKLLGLRAESA